MNRGSALLAVRIRLAISPSMRPRFMNRGSVVEGWSLGAQRTAFNEAPIHESGKSA